MIFGVKNILTNERKRSNRLEGYDYSLNGTYFITIATYYRLCLFGEVVDGKIILNQRGKIAFDQWFRLEKRFMDCDFLIFTIMPNHVHGIVRICRGAGEEFHRVQDQITPLHPYWKSNAGPVSLGTIIRSYKASVAYRINALRDCMSSPVWQRNYYDHIIRNNKEYQDICIYIEDNPRNWSEKLLDSNLTIQKEI